MISRVLAAAAVTAPAWVMAAPILVDDFSSVSVSYPLTVSVPGPGGSVVAPLDASAGAIGGSRQASATLVSADIPGLDVVQVGVFAFGPGLYDFNSTSGAVGTGRLRYGDIAGAAPLTGLAVPNGSTLDIEFQAFDAPAGGSILVNVVLNNTFIASGIGFTVSTPGPQTVNILLDAIDAGVRANVTGIEVIFNATKAVDFRLDSLAITIPEPSVLGVLAPFGLLLARRR